MFCLRITLSTIKTVSRIRWECPGSDSRPEFILSPEPRTAMQNIVKCCNRSGLHVADVALMPLACADAVLTDDEKDLGVALVDMGSGTTDISDISRRCGQTHSWFCRSAGIMSPTISPPVLELPSLMRSGSSCATAAPKRPWSPTRCDWKFRALPVSRNAPCRGKSYVRSSSHEWMRSFS